MEEDVFPHKPAQRAAALVKGGREGGEGSPLSGGAEGSRLRRDAPLLAIEGPPLGGNESGTAEDVRLCLL